MVHVEQTVLSPCGTDDAGSPEPGGDTINTKDEPTDDDGDVGAKSTRHQRRRTVSAASPVIVLSDSPLGSELTDSPRSSTMTEMSNTSTTGSALNSIGSTGTLGCHEKRHVCFCGKAFPYLSILESHMRCHTGERPFLCTFCDKRFAQKATLQVHERTHTGERPYKCKYCDKTFAQYGTKTVHEKSAHLGIRNYKCPKCSKFLSSPSALYTHKKTHGEKVFRCDCCPKTFTLKNYLKLHVKQVHEHNERKHVCQFCEKSFAYAGSLQVHVRTHTGERPYICKFCPKAFASQGNLQSHERTHTGERPYSCAQCGRSFIQKSQLTAHEATHGFVPGEINSAKTPPIPSAGVVLEVSNGSSGGVISKKQNEYVCKYCGKRYAYASSLYVHTRLHTGERPFRCGFCDKTFTNQGNMQVHQRVHTGEKPYKCNACDKSYAQKVGLKIHLEQCSLYQNARDPSSPKASPNNHDYDDSDEYGEGLAEKRKRLEDLLPKLFNGRLKPKPVRAAFRHHSLEYFTGQNRRRESSDNRTSPPGNGSVLRLPTIPAAGLNYSPPTMVNTCQSPGNDLRAFKTLTMPLEPVKLSEGPYSAFHGVIPTHIGGIRGEDPTGNNNRLDAQIVALKGLLDLSTGSSRSMDIQLNKSVIEHLDNQHQMAINGAAEMAAGHAAHLKGLVDLASSPVPLSSLQALLTQQLVQQHLLVQSEQWCNMLAAASAVPSRYPVFLPPSPSAVSFAGNCPSALPYNGSGVFIPPNVKVVQQSDHQQMIA